MKFDLFTKKNHCKAFKNLIQSNTPQQAEGMEKFPDKLDK